MKFAILSFLALAANSYIANSQDSNYIKNGNFAVNKCSSNWCLYNQANYKDQVANWYPQPQIEVGWGSVYSSKLSSTQRVLEMDGNKNTCVKQLIPSMNSGKYKLSITYVARGGVALADNSFSVEFNGNVLKNIIPVDYNVHSQDFQLPVNSLLTNAPIKLCGSGTSNSLGAIVSEVKMIKIQQNLIKNGDLSTNTCTAQWCLYTANTYKNNVDGWIPDPEIQIGYGYIYSSKLNKQRVFELDGNQNTCVKQVIPLLSSGIYQLQVIYGARKGVALSSDNKLGIHFNGKLVASPIPTDYELKTQIQQITLESQTSNVLFKVCGQGSSNGIGAFMRSAKLLRIGDAPVKIVPPVITSPVTISPVITSPVTISPVITSPVITSPFIPLTDSNYIKNGNFAVNKCSSNWCLYNQANYKDQVANWYPQPQIEVGWGSVYSSKLSSTQRVLEMDGNKNTCVKQLIPSMNSGKYKLSITYVARGGVALADNSFSVEFNGNVLKNIIPVDYNVHSQDFQLPVNSLLTNAPIKLCGSGTSNSLGAIVSEVKMIKIQQNLIKNGDLSTNTCTAQWCLYTANTYKNNVDGWIPDPEIQIGYGYIYSSKLNKQRVFELDGNQNTCVKQVIPLLSSGIYQLQVIYGARKGVALSSDNKLGIHFNGKLVASPIPTDYELKTQIQQITLESQTSNVLFKVCGQGSSNGIGAFMRSAKLLRIGDAPAKILPLLEPTIKPSVQPLPEPILPSVQPMPEIISQPSVQPLPEPILPSVQPMPEIISQPSVQPLPEPILPSVQPMPEIISQPSVQPLPEPILPSVQPMPEIISQPSVQPLPEPILPSVQPMPEIISQPSVQPLPEPILPSVQPMPEIISQPSVQPLPEPILPSVQPMPEIISQPSVQPLPEPILPSVQPMPEIISQPSVQPLPEPILPSVQPMPEIISQPSVQPLPEPILPSVQPMPEIISQPSVQPLPEPILPSVQPMPEIISQPSVQPLPEPILPSVQPMPEIISQPSVQPLPEPILPSVQPLPEPIIEPIHKLIEPTPLQSPIMTPIQPIQQIPIQTQPTLVATNLRLEPETTTTQNLSAYMKLKKILCGI